MRIARQKLPKRSASCKRFVTDYENDRLRLAAEMAVRFALALAANLLSQGVDCWQFVPHRADLRISTFLMWVYRFSCAGDLFKCPKP